MALLDAYHPNFDISKSIHMATWKKLQYVATKTTGVILGNLDDGIKPLGAKSEALKDLKDVKTASANSVDVAPGNTLDCARKRRLRPSGTVAKRLKYEKQANVKNTLQDLKQVSNCTRFGQMSEWITT